MTTPQRVFVPFFIASLVLTLTWGATLGMINLARLTGDWGLGTLPRTSVLAHAYVQVFGFMALFVMGVAHHVLPRFVGGNPAPARLVRSSFLLQVAGVVAIACGFFHSGALTRPLWISGSISLVAAAAIFARVVIATLASGAPGREPFRRWVAAGALWLVASAAIALIAAVTNDVSWHRVLWMAALAGFTSSWIFGVGSRILPIFLGCMPRWPRLDGAVFATYQLGAAAWVIGAWPNWDAPLFTVARTTGGILLPAAVVAYTACLSWLIPARSETSPQVRSPHDGWQRHVYGAWFWLFVSLALGPGWTIVRLVSGADDSLLLLDLSRHALAFGFAAQMVLGVASRVVPNFTGKPLWSTRARDIAFYCLNASMALRALELPIAFGSWVSAWPFIALAGPFGVAAMGMFATNIMMTVRSERVEMQGVMPAHTLTPLAARK